MHIALSEQLRRKGPLVWQVNDVLSGAECAALVERIEALGPADAPISTHLGPVMRPDIRNNARVMFDDVALSTRVYDRVRHTLPERIQGRVAVGANERLRCYRYLPGQYFASHSDGSFRRDALEESALTLMVYLNDGFEGGETNFHDLELSVTPRRGTALLFFHLLRHEGAEVRSGVKYALRSDVMYRGERSESFE